MSAPLLPDFTRWSSLELSKAEAAAIDFVNNNASEIAGTFESRICILQALAKGLKSKRLTFEDRMVYLSMIQELAQGLEQSAGEFFEIGCQPRVARMMRAAT